VLGAIAIGQIAIRLRVGDDEGKMLGRQIRGHRMSRRAHPSNSMRASAVVS